MKRRTEGWLQLVLVCCCLLLACPGIFAQDAGSVYLKGKVVDGNAMRLPGVTIVFKGSTVGTVTDNAGEFKLTMPSSRKEVVLTFSFVGMETLDVKVTDFRKELTVVMQEVSQTLDEVVKTGYYTTTKRRASGSVAVLTSESLKNKIPNSIDNLLQGQVAGVAVTNVGRPGAESKIRIRGTNTIEGNCEPLWVVDGVPLQDDMPEFDSRSVNTGNLNEIFMHGIAGINPADIENITILKDAAATAIYGSRAAGGVIVITTKQGKTGRIRVNYTSRYGMGLRPQRDGSLMNAREKLAWEQELWDEFSASNLASGKGNVPVVGIVGMIRANRLGKNGSLWTDDDFEAMSEVEQDAYIKELGNTTTDWYDEIFQNSFDMSHHLSFSGGNRMATYYGSVGYSSQEGLLKKDRFDRYNASLKVNWKPSDKLNWGVALSASKVESDGPSLNVDPFTYAYYANPYEKVYNEDGSYRSDMTYFNLGPINEGSIDPEHLPVTGFNIIRDLNETRGRSKKFTTNAQGTMDVNITRWLKFSGLMSYSRISSTEENYLGKESFAAWQDRLKFDRYAETDVQYGSLTHVSGNGENYSVRGQLAFTDTFLDDHYVNLLFGSELRGAKNKRASNKKYGYDPETGLSVMPENPNPDKYDYEDYIELIEELSGFARSESKFASFYASLEYAFKERYIFNASFRFDGSNNFGSKEQFNPTWSLGAAWHVDQEGFMQNVSEVLNRLTLRAATGFTGNVVPGKMRNLVIEYDPYKNWNGGLVGSIQMAPNPHLRWEKTQDFKVALDFGLFNDRISGQLETYYRKSKDVISKVRVVSSTGFQDQSYNSSEITNKGFEASLRTRIVDAKDFKMNLNANFAWNYNELSKYRSPNGGIKEGKYAGYPLEAVFGGKQTGIDPYDGVYTYRLRPDAVINKASDLKKQVNYRYFLGTSIAPYTGGFYLDLKYKNLSLGIGGAYSLGAVVDSRPYTTPANSECIAYGFRHNEVPQTLYSDLYTNHLNVKSDRTDRWTRDRRTGVKYPRIVDAFGEKLHLDQYNPTKEDSGSIVSGSFLEEVDYLRIRDITLAYNMPGKVLKHLGLSSLQFSLMMSNFFTFTNYSGIDPETPGNTYPITRSVAFGINLGF